MSPDPDHPVMEGMVCVLAGVYDALEHAEAETKPAATVTEIQSAKASASEGAAV